MRAVQAGEEEATASETKTMMISAVQTTMASVIQMTSASARCEEAAAADFLQQDPEKADSLVPADHQPGDRVRADSLVPADLLQAEPVRQGFSAAEGYPCSARPALLQVRTFYCAALPFFASIRQYSRR